ncbi:Protein of unknown function [Gryllus bimaculatus]|nr:Protein of unknown function [Gryllus bimaculatus]
MLTKRTGSMFRAQKRPKQGENGRRPAISPVPRFAAFFVLNPPGRGRVAPFSAFVSSYLPLPSVFALALRAARGAGCEKQEVGNEERGKGSRQRGPGKGLRSGGSHPFVSERRLLIHSQITVSIGYVKDK